ncbi:tryptophan synthase subunit alpha [Trueperella sp. LYQ143]|uniref:tryptophan synthase subunit alpha n=1 Tax=unclassified Trueperella TaxID=2630174 RepID=UPI003983BB5B
MTRYTAQVIDERRKAGQAAFIGYLPVGFPSVSDSIAAARRIVDAGVDIVELGMPYSDPTMDGAIIQQATTAALARGVRQADMFRAVEAVANTGAAVVIMSYYNPIFRYGIERYARDLANAGGAGLITPDLVPDEAAEWIAASDDYGLERIFLVAPSSTDERLAYTVGHTRGFVYAASRMGVTGVQDRVASGAEDLVARTRRAGARNVCLGIGVSNADQARDVAQYADGVIVGSALVRTLIDHDGDTPTALDTIERIAAEIASGAHVLRGDVAVTTTKGN